VLSPDDNEDIAVFAALADPIRLQIVKHLAGGRELAGTTLAERLGISRALLCHHTGILVSAGIASKRKVGAVGYVRLSSARLRRSMRRIDRRATRTRRTTR
jgi:ArsR family transcriptional regulator, arsenate/arsenite/antimonite-responsive transcriptional repressor